MFGLIGRLISDECGMETVEWGVIAAMIVGAVILALGTLGANVKAVFDVLVTNTK
jgi:Flp pilus assembly pilin Flp